MTARTEPDRSFLELEMSYSFYDAVGNLGVALVIGSYFMIQIGRLSATGLAYTVLNILGAAFILYSLYFEFNMSAFLVELFWLLISLLGLGRILLERRRAV
jgi:hypothetical protein